MEWSYHPLIEDKCQYPYKKEPTKYNLKNNHQFLFQIHKHETVLVYKFEFETFTGISCRFNGYFHGINSTVEIALV